MGKSSVSIPYLVAWILGIIVLALAVYLIYKYIKRGPLDCSQCSAEFTAWCVRCYKIHGSEKTNWDGGENYMDDELKECIGRCTLGIDEHDSCNDLAFDDCKAFIGL